MEMDLFPLPESIKIRQRKLGARPVSPLVPTPRDTGDSSAPRPAFENRWENQFQLDEPVCKITVIVREQDNGRLIANVFCTDAGLLSKAAVSVGLIGAVEVQTIRKTIPLDIPDKDGCGGSADFGALTEAVKKLGPQIGIIIFLLV